MYLIQYAGTIGGANGKRWRWRWQERDTKQKDTQTPTQTYAKNLILIIGIERYLNKKYPLVRDMCAEWGILLIGRECNNVMFLLY